MLCPKGAHAEVAAAATALCSAAWLSLLLSFSRIVRELNNIESIFQISIGVNLYYHFTSEEEKLRWNKMRGKTRKTGK